MEKSFCSLHYGEEEKYLCSHPTCLKLEGNKPMCIECLEKHKKGRTKFHEKITIQQVSQIAEQNIQSYIQIMESSIKECEKIALNYEQNLCDQLASIIKWQDDQFKMIKSAKEAQITILKENIIKAKEHYQKQQLDNLLYFYRYNLREEISQSQEFQNETEMHLSQQFKEISVKVEALISKYCNMQGIFNAKSIEFELQETAEQDFKFEKCEFHKAKKNYVCTHLILKQEKQFELSCLGCLERSHELVCKEKCCLKKVTTIQKEQEILKNKMQEESQKMQTKVVEIFEKQIDHFNLQQKQSQEFFDKLKNELIEIERETIKRLKKKHESKLIEGNIDLKLLPVTDKTIEDNLQSEFESLKRKIQLLETNEFDISGLLLEIDEQCDQEKENTIEMTQEIQILKQKAYLYDTQALRSQSLNKEQEITQILEEVQKLAQIQVKIESNNGKTDKLVQQTNEINNQLTSIRDSQNKLVETTNRIKNQLTDVVTTQLAQSSTIYTIKDTSSLIHKSQTAQFEKQQTNLVTLIDSQNKLVETTNRIKIQLTDVVTTQLAQSSTIYTIKETSSLIHKSQTAQFEKQQTNLVTLIDSQNKLVETTNSIKNQLNDVGTTQLAQTSTIDTIKQTPNIILKSQTEQFEKQEKSLLNLIESQKNQRVHEINLNGNIDKIKEDIIQQTSYLKKIYANFYVFDNEYHIGYLLLTCVGLSFLFLIIAIMRK